MPPEVKKNLKISLRNGAIIITIIIIIISLTNQSSFVSLHPHPPFRKLLFFARFRFLIFHPFFRRGSADPICPYVRTPMQSDRLPVSVCGAGRVLMLIARSICRRIVTTNGRTARR